MNESLLIEITVFVLAAFVGIEVINRVPTTLHTPLMSGTDLSTLTNILGAIAVAFGASNVVGGFLVTDRMLEMFKKRPTPEKKDE